jgi:hypothetical protein
LPFGNNLICRERREETFIVSKLPAEILKKEKEATRGRKRKAAT